MLFNKVAKVRNFAEKDDAISLFRALLTTVFLS